MSGGSIIIKPDEEPDFRSDINLRMLRYWRQKAAGSLLARRDDMAPADHPELWTHAVISGVEVDGDGTPHYRIRYFGTLLAGFYGEQTGRLIDELPVMRRTIARTLRANDLVLESRLPVWTSYDSTFSYDRDDLQETTDISVDVLTCPLTTDGETINQLIATMVVARR